MNVIEDGTVIVQGCPVADGGTPCHGCGGNWPGTLANSEHLTQAARSGRLRPERLKCGLIEQNATQALQALSQTGVVFESVAPATDLVPAD